MQVERTFLQGNLCHDPYRDRRFIRCAFGVCHGSSSPTAITSWISARLAGYEVANPCGLNSSGGVVTGMYVTTATPAHMFLYTGGTTGSMNDLTSDFITSGGLISSAINDSGQLAVNRMISGWLYSGGLTGTATLLPGDRDVGHRDQQRGRHRRRPASAHRGLSRPHHLQRRHGLSLERPVRRH